MEALGSVVAGGKRSIFLHPPIPHQVRMPSAAIMKYSKGFAKRAAATFSGDTPNSPAITWPSRLVVILAAIFVVVVGVLSLLPRERVHRWLEKLFKRAKIAAGGAERTVDSHAFKKALTAWHDVIALGDPTPRGIKRFVNRVRLFAMRERAVYDDKTEASQATSRMRRKLYGPLTKTPLDDATLVALAALHHVGEELSDMGVFEKGNYDVPEVLDSRDNKTDTIQSAIRKHEKAGLPWPPTPEQIQRFKVIAQGFHLR